MEFAIFILILVTIFLTRSIWNPWLQASADTVYISLKDQEADMQKDIKEVHDKQENLIKENGKWFTIKDLDRK